jgi:hypothetical protein
MEAQHDSIDPQQGRINAALDRLAELCDLDPVIAAKIELDAISEAQAEAEVIRDELRAAGVTTIEIASQLRKGKPR